MTDIIEIKANHILEQLKRDKRLGKYVDFSLPIPKLYCGTGEIKLIVLGQDPTVKNVKSRRFINVVLNLDKKGSVKSYITKVCNGLGILINENVYATNLYKNFFVNPPTQILNVDIFQEFLNSWLALLKEELGRYLNIPVITLGEPILAPLVNQGVPDKVRKYWGYIPEWKNIHLYSFKYINPQDNKLERILFPFPHQPSLSKPFYKAQMIYYISFVKTTAFS